MCVCVCWSNAHCLRIDSHLFGSIYGLRDHQQEHSLTTRFLSFAAITLIVCVFFFAIFPLAVNNFIPSTATPFQFEWLSHLNRSDYIMKMLDKKNARGQLRLRRKASNRIIEIDTVPSLKCETPTAANLVVPHSTNLQLIRNVLIGASFGWPYYGFQHQYHSWHFLPRTQNESRNRHVFILTHKHCHLHRSQQPNIVVVMRTQPVWTNRCFSQFFPFARRWQWL